MMPKDLNYKIRRWQWLLSLLLLLLQVHYASRIHLSAALQC
jgi:hypothetical protein